MTEEDVCRILNEPIKCFQTHFEDRKPLIDGRKFIEVVKNIKILMKR